MSERFGQPTPLGAAAQAFVQHLQRVQQNLESAARAGKLPPGNPEPEVFADANPVSRTYGQDIARVPWVWMIQEIAGPLGERVPSPAGAMQIVAAPRPSEGIASHAARLLQAGTFRLASAGEITEALERQRRNHQIALAEDRDNARKRAGTFYDAASLTNAAVLPPVVAKV